MPREGTETKMHDFSNLRFHYYLEMRYPERGRKFFKVSTIINDYKIFRDEFPERGRIYEFLTINPKAYGPI